MRSPRKLKQGSGDGAEPTVAARMSARPPAQDGDVPMSTSEYTSPPSPAIRHQRLLGFGTAHAGPEWSAAVRALRAAIAAAKVVAPRRTKPAEDEIAEAVIDHVGHLDAHERVVLAAILGVFFRKANGNS